MIERYSREEMKKIWELDSKFAYYLKVELAVCDAYAQNGDFPIGDIEELKKSAAFSVARIDEIEREVRLMLLRSSQMLMKIWVNTRVICTSG